MTNAITHYIYLTRSDLGGLTAPARHLPGDIVGRGGGEGLELCLEEDGSTPLVDAGVDGQAGGQPEVGDGQVDGVFGRVEDGAHGVLVSVS